MTTATLSAAQCRQRSTAGGAANGINKGGGGGQPSLSPKGKQAAAASAAPTPTPTTTTSSPVPGLSSAPDWPSTNTSPPVVQRLSSSSEFWERCVVARQPGVLPASALDDDGDGDDDGGEKSTKTLFTAPSRWTPAYLKAKAGHVLVDVETRRDASDRFGKGGAKAKMTFAEFIDKVSTSTSSSSFSKKGGNRDEGSLLYLSAQKPPKTPRGKTKGATLPPPPLGPLALALADDFPLVPKLAKGLVLQSVNLWCGRSSSSSTNPSSSPSTSTSSGLHHDFHDNLYAVVGGTKKFTLFPPRAVCEMRPVGGKPRFVHSNGRIVYRAQGEVGADGGDERLVRRHEYRRWREVMLADGVEVDDDDDEDEEDESDDDDDESDGDDDGAKRKRLFGNSDDDDDEDDDADLVAALAAAERGAPVADDYSGEGEGEGEEEEEESDDDGDDDESDDDLGDPPSFSTLDPREPAHAALLPMHRAATVDVGPGDLLYLPCGWFHEVVSSSSSNVSSSTTATSESICSPLHLALNFWFHPPDRARANPSNPYSRPYWRELFVDVVAGEGSERLRDLCERQGTVVDVDDDYGFGGEGEGGEGKEEKKNNGGNNNAADDAAARAAAVEALREGLDELDALMAGGDSDSSRSSGGEEMEEDESESEEEELDAAKKKKKLRA
jgi:hypothetical protein